MLTQQSNSPKLSTKHNGVSSPQQVSLSPKISSSMCVNTNNKQQVSPQPPPVPAKPKYRVSNTQFTPINVDNRTLRKTPQNGFEIDEVKEQ